VSAAVPAAATVPQRPQVAPSPPGAAPPTAPLFPLLVALLAAEMEGRANPPPQGTGQEGARTAQAEGAPAGGDSPGEAGKEPPGEAPAMLPLLSLAPVAMASPALPPAPASAAHASDPPLPQASEEGGSQARDEAPAAERLSFLVARGVAAAEPRDGQDGGGESAPTAEAIARLEALVAREVAGRPSAAPAHDRPSAAPAHDRPSAPLEPLPPSSPGTSAGPPPEAGPRRPVASPSPAEPASPRPSSAPGSLDPAPAPERTRAEEEGAAATPSAPSPPPGKASGGAPPTSESPRPGDPAPSPSSVLSAGLASPAAGELTRSSRAASPVRLRELAERVGAEVRLLVREGRSEARISLRPPELGEVRIRLAYEGSALSAVISADSAAAADALVAALGDLRRSLEGLGVSVLSLDVRSPQADEQGARPRPEGPFEGRRPPSHQGSADGGRETGAGRQPSTPRGALIDVFA
jgi:hypothetical protein